jgi:hypothetical protein
MGASVTITTTGVIMAKPAVHTVPAEAGWKNVHEGSDRALSTHSTKAEAQRAGRDRARSEKVEHVVHTKDGRVSERNSYGNDPASRPG